MATSASASTKWPASLLIDVQTLAPLLGGAFSCGLGRRHSNQPCGWALGWWVCRLTGRPCWLHLKDLDLAPLRGGAFSVAGRCATGCGIVSVGLPLTRISASPRKELSPAPRRGFFMLVLHAARNQLCGWVLSRQVCR